MRASIISENFEDMGEIHSVVHDIQLGTEWYRQADASSFILLCMHNCESGKVLPHSARGLPRNCSMK